MLRHSEYGLEWDLDTTPAKGQLGLLREDHYRHLFAPGQRDESFKPNDVWLDIGANIGAFALRAAQLVHSVVAVEPEPNCCQQLRRNIELNGLDNIWVGEAAIVGGSETEVSLAISNSYSSTHRVGTIRGRKSILVSAYNIDDFVKANNVNKIKMDCEGSELEILQSMDLTPIDEIVFEYHFSMIGVNAWSSFWWIIEKLKISGLKIMKAPTQESKTWHTIVWARRT